jgi:hypothetical protein
MWKTQKVQKKSQKSRAKFEAKNGSKMAQMNTKIWRKSAENLHKNVGQIWTDLAGRNGRFWDPTANDLAAKII